MNEFAHGFSALNLKCLHSYSLINTGQNKILHIYNPKIGQVHIVSWNRLRFFQRRVLPFQVGNSTPINFCRYLARSISQVQNHAFHCWKLHNSSNTICAANPIHLLFKCPFFSCKTEWECNFFYISRLDYITPESSVCNVSRHPGCSWMYALTRCDRERSSWMCRALEKEQWSSRLTDQSQTYRYCVILTHPLPRMPRCNLHGDTCPYLTPASSHVWTHTLTDTRPTRHVWVCGVMDQKA